MVKSHDTIATNEKIPECPPSSAASRVTKLGPQFWWGLLVRTAHECSLQPLMHFQLINCQPGEWVQSQAILDKLHCSLSLDQTKIGVFSKKL